MDFRLYFMGGHNHIEKAVDLQCEDGAAAVQSAEKKADGRRMELRRLAGKIRSLPRVIQATIQALNPDVGFRA